MPLLQEYYYGTRWDPARFDLAKLRAKLTGGPVEEVDEEEAPAQEQP
jgi:hypothetical protein